MSASVSLGVNVVIPVWSDHSTVHSVTFRSGTRTRRLNSYPNNNDFESIGMFSLPNRMTAGAEHAPELLMLKVH